MNQNLILDTDSYKASHWLQYPAGTMNLFNYLESRGGTYKETVFFGLQYLLQEYLTTPVSHADVLEVQDFFKKHGVPFNTAGWMGIVQDHGGYIPLRIKAVPEGTVVPVGMPMLTAVATDPKYFWVVGWFETMMMRLWYPITVATLSHDVKKTIRAALVETGDVAGLPFKLHDFGSRGVSSKESAAIGGAAHLVNFMGSDTLAGVLLANEYYLSDMAGFSIPAAEHSTITSWGREHEVDAFRNMLKQFAKPGSLVAVVSDSYDIYKAAEKLWGETLRQEVIDSGATVIIRPDSGDPVMVVNILLHTLAEKFGTVTNSKGFKVLNNVRIIQGDGLNPYTIGLILKSCKLAGFSADNVAFGMGGGLLQQVTRDTQKFAYKCSAIQMEGTAATPEGWVDVYKQPVDQPDKKSKAGRIGLGKDSVIGYHVTGDESPLNILETVFENGTILKMTTFAEVRARANEG